MAKMEIWPVLIAGGKGTRFWPLSRKRLPKQLLCLASSRPLICTACEILKPVTKGDRIFISTSRELAPAVQKALPEISAANFILEPEGRDTAPAIGLALAQISRKLDPQGPEPVLAFLPSDHHIEKPAGFRKVLLKSAQIAMQNDLIVTIGIKPKFASTGFGYIQPGRTLADAKEARHALKFTEKPKADKAAKYLKQGFLWNAGMFIARPSVLWKVFAQNQPEMYRHLQKILRASDLKSAVKTEFKKLPKISFDYAVMEKAKNVAVVKGDFGWSDIGSYRVLRSVLGKRGAMNAGKGKLVSINSDGMFVHTTKLAATVCVSNLAIIETEDALLVMDLSGDAKLKELIAELERLGLKEYL